MAIVPIKNKIEYACDVNDMMVECPKCKKKVKWVEENKYRPFCDQRCFQYDLGDWFNEKYRIRDRETS